MMSDLQKVCEALQKSKLWCGRGARRPRAQIRAGPSQPLDRGTTRSGNNQPEPPLLFLKPVVVSQKAAGATMDLRLRVLLPPLASEGLNRSGRPPAAVQRKFASGSMRRASPGVSWATGPALPSRLATPL
ncbi:unnamed protein product [Rangifer tarandus platyrhynchus]|uniref:Uncharacterized protein n=1 Tax=Rangifer tarandus platyrhynchus TaxID=3082113 RepID=A0AC59ZWV9_RANTA